MAETMCFWFKDGRKVFKRGRNYFLYDPSLKEAQYRGVSLGEMAKLEREVQDEMVEDLKKGVRVRK